MRPLTTLPGRLSRIFERYADGRLSVTLGGGPLLWPDGTEHGVLDGAKLERARLHVTGWSDAPRVGLRQGTSTAWTTPDLIQPGSTRRGFTLDVPFQPGPFDILAEDGPKTTVTSFPGLTAPQVNMKRRLLWGPYLGDIARLAPVIWRWKAKGDLGQREIVKERLHLVPPAPQVALRTDALGAVPPAGPVTATLVLPVHNAFDVLQDCLSRLDAHTDTQAIHLIVIEDASTDDRIAPFLTDWAAPRPWVTLLRNAANLGFIGSVNRGFEQALSHSSETPIVLINSDALVPANWLPRLLSPLADPQVASVTPLSNDAELFTVPVICARHDLPEGLGDALDAAAQDLAPQPQADVPAGVGFCMALNPRFVTKLAPFDTVFGRGYGEEVDWCQRARAMGGRHVAAPNLFVEHRGGSSFGSADKQALLQRNADIISKRYPNFDREVQDVLRTDPLGTTRLAMALSFAALTTDGPVPVYLAHAMGGGAENWLKARLRDETAAILRVGHANRWGIEVHTPQGVTAGTTDDDALMRALITRLPHRRMIYSCGVNDPAADQLPAILIALSEGQPAPEILFHDFFPLSPSYTLQGADGTFHETLDPSDPAHTYERRGGTRVPLQDWQAAWGALADRAGQLTVFSEDSARHVARTWPQVAPKIAVRPHDLPALPPRILAGHGDIPTVAALGNIGPQKGADVLQAFSKDLARRGDLRLVILGHLSPDHALAPPAIVHGSYELRDLPGLVQRYGIQGWLIPSVWPETFSFTTHEALATGLPVMSFDLGAQGDAVKQALTRGNPGAVFPLGTPPTLDADAILDVLARARTGAAA